MKTTFPQSSSSISKLRYHELFNGKLICRIILNLTNNNNNNKSSSNHQQQHNSVKLQIFIHRIFVLLLTFAIYATYRLSRRPLSIVKSVLHNEKCDHVIRTATMTTNTISTTTMILAVTSLDKSMNQTGSSLSLSSMANYQTKIATCGWSPFDEPNGKQLLGLLDSCFLFMYMFGTYGNGYIADRTNIRHFLSISLILCGVISIAFGLARPLGIHSLWYFISVQALAGYISASMPAVISVVGQWFCSTKKGLIFGIWNWHSSVGTILGSLIAGNWC